MSTISVVVFAQEYANQSYYLVDSLDLSNVEESEMDLLESSLKQYHEAKDDTTKLQAIGIIIEQSWDDNIWPKYNRWAYEFALRKQKSTPNKQVLRRLRIEEAKALGNFGYIKVMEGDYEEAKKLLKRCITINRAVNHPKGEAVGLNNLAGAYEITGEVENALDNFLASLAIQRKLGDQNLIGATLNNIGGIYDNLGQLETAIEFYEEAIELQKEIGNMQGVSTTLNNMGTIYMKKINYDKAMECFNRSLALLEEGGSKQDVVSTFSNIGDVLLRTDQYQKAIKQYNKCLEMQQEIGDRFGVANSYRNLGRAYQRMGELRKASGYFEKSLSLSKEIGAAQLIRDAALKLTQLNESLNKYDQALAYYKTYILMRDSMKNESLQKESIKQLARYEYEKQKAIDDAEHEKKLAIEQEAKEKQQIITYATAGGLGLVGIFLVFVFNRLKVTRKQKGIIEDAHGELEEKNTEIMDSIAYAKRIQSAILPPDKLVKEYLDKSFILYKPKDIVAGDFYWLEHKANKVLFAAADCTGHGVPGAMVSVVCNNGLNRSVREHGLSDPGKILDQTRDIVVQEFEKSEEEVKDGMDIALCSLQFHTPNTQNQTPETAVTLQYAGAHNPLWIIRKDTDVIEEIKADKQPIGQMDNPTPYTTHEVKLNAGDTFYIFSDGYADQFGGEKGKKMKTANFKKLLLSIKDKSMPQQEEFIDEAFEHWKGDLEQLDDVCVIGVRV